MKILCYGDSNTYGWDPRYFSGNRYAHPWPELLAEMTGHEVINCGEPGRIIPRRSEHMDWFIKDVETHEPDLLIIMLGTNDILDMAEPDAEEPARRMGEMVGFILGRRLAGHILLLSAPDTDLDDRPYHPALADLSKRYRHIAEKAGIGFADPFSWEIPMAFDRTHFSEEGHSLFAKKLAAVIADLKKVGFKL